MRVVDEVLAATQAHAVTIIQAEPGAGKTTILPLALLPLLDTNKKILVLEPRRIAAKNAALRMSQLLNQNVGKTVGYRVRNETKISPTCCIEVITEAIFMRMVQADPELSEVAFVLFDEFHERNLASDLGLAFALEVQENLRDDLKVIVMSATLEVEKLMSLFSDATLIKSEGREYPVEVHYRPNLKQNDERIELLKVIKEFLTLSASKNFPPNLLCFFPGVGEIKKAHEYLSQALMNDTDIIIFELHGRLPFSQQQQVVQPTKGKRKIILATNIAESSITIDGVGCVIDTGLIRQAVFDPNVGFNRLRTLTVSNQSARQRAGRAGRVAAGICYRLWNESTNLREASQPEIQRADLTSAVLEMSHWGIKKPDELRLLDRPNSGSFAQAQQLLQDLGAIDARFTITDHGKVLAKFAAHPRLAHMILFAKERGLEKLACLIAAMLEEKDVLVSGNNHNADFLSRVHYCLDNKSSSSLVKRIFKQASQYEQLVNKVVPIKASAQTVEHSIHELPFLLILAFPDRLAQKRGKGYRLANGAGVQGPPVDLFKSEYIVATQLGGERHNSKIYQAVEIEKAMLIDRFKKSITRVETTFWDDKSESVRSEIHSKIGELVLSRQANAAISAELIVQGLAEGIQSKGISALPWTEALKQWRAKIRLLKQTQSLDISLPDLSDDWLLENLSEWLLPFLNGLSKLSQIDSKILQNALNSLLSWEAMQQIESLMPERYLVASGSKIKIDYLKGDKPILAVKLQEMFGELQSPRLANGQLSVVLHLLSPAGRPLQITEDLSHFWQTSYQDVKKEMRGRYPKHPWPDDPLTAQATRHTKRRLGPK